MCFLNSDFLQARFFQYVFYLDTRLHFPLLSPCAVPVCPGEQVTPSQLSIANGADGKSVAGY